MKRWIVILICTAMFGAACAGDSIFSAIGTNMSNPLTVAVNSTAERAYVLNANDQYNFTGGSVHIVDLSTLTSPTRLAATDVASFSGELHLDTANNVLVMSNRFSEHSEVTSDALFSVSVAGDSFGTVNSSEASLDPFGLVVNAAQDTMYVASNDDKLDVFDLSAAAPARSVQQSLLATLSDNSTFTAVSAEDLVLINNGTQLVVTRAEGGLLILNVSELGNADAKPVDYFINDITDPRAIARLGDASSTTILVADVVLESGNTIDRVYRLDLSSLAASASNETTAVIDKDDVVLQATIVVGTLENELDDPQQMIVSENLSRAYLTLKDSDRVVVINTDTNEVETNITVGEEPFGMALYQATAGTDTHLLVANRVSNTVSIIDLSTNEIVGTYP